MIKEVNCLLQFPFTFYNSITVNTVTVLVTVLAIQLLILHKEIKIM